MKRGIVLGVHRDGNGKADASVSVLASGAVRREIRERA
jgi:hypothetical protein